MSYFVESLRRLYQEGKITLAKIDSLLQKGAITQDEYEYITS